MALADPLTFDAACPTCGEPATWQHSRGAIHYDDQGLSHEDSGYEIMCEGCGT